MRGKGMTQRMWRRMLDQASTPRRLTHRPLDGFLMQVMAMNAVPAWILRAIARRENELPSPLLRRIRILARQRERQISFAKAFGQIALMQALPCSNVAVTARRHALAAWLPDLSGPYHHAR